MKLEMPGTTKRLRRRPRALVLHAGLSAVVSGFFVVTWLLSRNASPVPQEFWPGWIMLLLGIPLGIHAAFVLAARPRQQPPGHAPPARAEAAPRERAPVHPATDPADRTLATVLFTDIVGSTEQARSVGDQRWGQLLDAHDRLARELVERFAGRLIKSTGDGILAVFDRPGRGIRCAAALRDALHGIGVQIRAGLHTGEVQIRGADVGGIAVHIAARVMATASAGEVLVSRTVHDLVTGSDYVLEDRGAHTLKGMTGEWQLFAVRA
jgi:class 3 adenylate cyclase